jgi:hypothetical protein
LCRKDVKLKQLSRVILDEGSGAPPPKMAKPEPGPAPGTITMFETKLKALMIKLDEIRSSDPSAKVTAGVDR